MTEQARPATLPEALATHFETSPDRPLLWEERRGWVTAGDLDRASRQAAARLAGAGLRPGDRILMSAATSVELVETHVAALRLGLVVVPANTAYREREIAHLVSDAGPRAAVVDDPDRAGWIRRADPDVLVVGPDVDLGVRPLGAPALDAARPEDPAILGYTSGDDGHAEGRRPQPRQPPGVVGVRPSRLALDGRRPARAGPAVVPHPRPRRRAPRHAPHRSLGRPPAPFRTGRGPRRRRRPRRHALLRSADDVRPAGRVAPPRRARPAAVVRIGLRAASAGRLRPAGRRQRAADPRALRHDRDGHERVEPLRRRAPPRHGRLSPPRRRPAPG